MRAAAADGADWSRCRRNGTCSPPARSRRPAPSRSTGPASPRPAAGRAQLGIHLLAGSIAEHAGKKAFNTSVLIGPEGEDLAVYRKIHMFDVDAGGVSYRESEHERAGEEIVTAPRRGRPSA